MAKHYLDPAFVRINYQSTWGLHTMTVPSVPIDNVGPGLAPTFTLRGLELPVEVNTAVHDFVNVIKTRFAGLVTFVDYIAFTQASPTAMAVPVDSGALGIAGTNSDSPATDKATQRTFTWRTDAFGLLKLVMLDCRVDVWERITSKAAGEVAAVDTYVTADASWLAGRDGGKPTTFLGMESTLNEKLRRAYRMT